MVVSLLHYKQTHKKYLVSLVIVQVRVRRPIYLKYNKTRKPGALSAPTFLGPCGAGTLASRAGGPSAPMGGLRPHGSALRAQSSQICDGKSPLNQPALIMSVYFPKFVTENPPSASQT